MRRLLSKVTNNRGRAMHSPWHKYITRKIRVIFVPRRVRRTPSAVCYLWHQTLQLKTVPVLRPPDGPEITST